MGIAVAETYFGDGVGGIYAVVLFRIVPASAEIDEWLWVVVGDLPPLYLVTDDAPTPADAMRAYIEPRDEWITAAREHKPLDEIAPVNVPATREWADSLDSRLRYSRTNYSAAPRTATARRGRAVSNGRGATPGATANRK